MKRLFIILAVTLLYPLPSFGKGMFKCIDGNSVTWQEVACTTSSGDLQTLPPERPVRRAEGEATDAVQRSGGKDITRAEFQLGVLDLHVLNNRRWGKPQRIKRSREAGAWHEYWAYETGPNAGTQLHFINGRLAGIEGSDSPASAASAAIIEVRAGR